MTNFTYKAIIAEDDKFLSNALRVKLTKEGFEVRIAADGNELMEILRTFIPNIILLDLVMPNKDGFESLEEIKSNPNYKEIPVIITSNLGQKDDIDLCMKLGASDYIVKTNLTLDELMKKIKSFIK